MPLRWLVRVSVRSWGPAPITAVGFGLDERLQDPLQRRADRSVMSPALSASSSSDRSDS